MIKITTDAWEKEYKLDDKEEAKISILLDILLSYAQDSKNSPLDSRNNGTILQLAKSLSKQHIGN